MVWVAIFSFAFTVCFEVFRWRRTIRLFGNVPRWVPCAMLKFARVGRSRALINVGALSLVVSFICLAFFIADVRSRSFGILAFLLASTGLSILSRSAQPPAVLLLTRSSPRTVELIKRFGATIFPLRVVALVDYRVFLPFNASIWIDNLRTSDSTVWKSVVIGLIDLAAVVVIDTSGESRSVAEEASLMLAPGRIRKAVFLTDNLGRYPALSANGIDPHAHALRLLNVDDMVGELAHYSLGRNYLRWPIEFPPNAPCNPMIKEDWAGLPSVFMVGHTSGFDSRWLIDAALRSDKDLLACSSPSFNVSRSGAEHLLSLNWEFVHDAQLAAIMIRDQEIVVRIAFLREFATRLPPVSAIGPRSHRPLTFEELNQPDPVNAALWEWAHAIENIAKSHGWRIRYVMPPPNDEMKEPL